MEAIITINSYKDLAIILLVTIIITKILLIMAYYRGVSDTRNTINGVLKSDLSTYQKFNK